MHLADTGRDDPGDVARVDPATRQDADPASRLFDEAGNPPSAQARGFCTTRRHHTINAVPHERLEGHGLIGALVECTMERTAGDVPRLSARRGGLRRSTGATSMRP